MAWTDLTFAFESVLTATKMTQLQANFAAMANGDSGSPIIQPAALDANALRFFSGTAVATTSGTSIDFTGLPTGLRQIIVLLAGVSTNGTSPPIIQIGDSGGVENTGYSGTVNDTGTNALMSAGFSLASAYVATTAMHGAIVLTLLNSATNTWAVQGGIGLSGTAGFSILAGSKSLSAELDRIRLTTAGGVNTFDAGTMNILYG